MKIKIDFFSGDLIEAIGSGVYEVAVTINGEATSLYIGESTFVLVRCASHLYELKKKPEYFGFSDDLLGCSDIGLRFSLIIPEGDRSRRKEREKIEIEKCKPKPLCQSGLSDRMKPIEEKVEALAQFLKTVDNCYKKA